MHKNLSVEVDDKKQNLVIYENTVFFNVWSYLIAALMVVLIVYMPLQLSEQELVQNLNFVMFDLFVDCFFMLDVVINFFVSYRDNSGREIDDHCKITSNYLKSWFFIDLLSSVPFGYILYLNSSTDASGSDDSGSGYRYNNLGRLFKIPRYYRFLKIAKIFRVFQSLKYKSLITEYVEFLNLSNTSLGVLRNTLVLLVVCHLMVCLYINLAANNSPNWFDSWCTSYQDFDCGSRFHLYTVAWYFVIQTVTTVGYGDVSTTNINEQWFKIFAIILGSYLWSSVVATITQIQLESAIDGMADRETKDKIDKILMKYRLQGKSLANLDILMKKSGVTPLIEDYSLLKTLPDRYSREVLTEIYEFMGQRIENFAEKPIIFMEEIYQKLFQKYYSENEPIWVQKERSKYIYINGGGKAVFVDEFIEKYELSYDGIFKIVDSGEILGLEEAFIFEECKYSCISKETSEFYYLQIADFWQVYSKYGYSGEVVQMISGQYRFYVSNMVALVFILHLFYKKKYYTKAYDILLLLHTYNIVENLNLLYPKNLKKFHNTYNSKTNDNEGHYSSLFTSYKQGFQSNAKDGFAKNYKDYKDYNISNFSSLPPRSIVDYIQYLDYVVFDCYKIQRPSEKDELSSQLEDNVMSTWWHYFLQDRKYARLISEVTNKYLGNCRRLKNVHKLLANKQKQNSAQTMQNVYKLLQNPKLLLHSHYSQSTIEKQGLKTIRGVGLKGAIKAQFTTFRTPKNNDVINGSISADSVDNENLHDNLHENENQDENENNDQYKYKDNENSYNFNFNNQYENDNEQSDPYNNSSRNLTKGSQLASSVIVNEGHVVESRKHRDKDIMSDTDTLKKKYTRIRKSNIGVSKKDNIDNKEKEKENHENNSMLTNSVKPQSKTLRFISLKNKNSIVNSGKLKNPSSNTNINIESKSLNNSDISENFENNTTNRKVHNYENNNLIKKTQDEEKKKEKEKEKEKDVQSEILELKQEINEVKEMVNEICSLLNNKNSLNMDNYNND